jgi:hypothetical protein
MKKNSEISKSSFEKHKKKVLVIGGCCVTFAMGWMIKGSIDSKKFCELSEEIIQKDRIIIRKDRIINILQKACKNKDSFMRRFFSQGTRDGYSECARQLSYMRRTANN